jgi:hypothetical protein
MVTLNSLREQLGEIGELQVQADGYALRMLWQGNVNPVVVQTLEDYGGLKIAEDPAQALWFFFSTDVMLAVARLGVWARFNALTLALEVFPARFQSDRRGRKALILDEALWQQELTAPKEFQIWVHKSLAETVEKLPGLKLLEDGANKNPAPALWSLLEVDSRLPYQSPLSWYAVLHPVGTTQDKDFLSGWREFLTQLEAVLQRNKFRFSIHDFYLMFPLESMRQIKDWCRDYLTLVDRLKTEAPGQYWPCVLAVVDRRGMTLNEDLPAKVGVAWEHLVPDYPHMSMRNALTLGDEFAAHEVLFAPVRQSPDDWASISLAGDENEAGAALPQLAPVNLVMGGYNQCFYCGQRSHESAKCPSRRIEASQSSIWPRVARLDFDAMRQAVRDVNAMLEGCENDEARETVIAAELRENSERSVMLKAFYDIVWPVQLRAINFFWRARNKDLKKAAKDLASVGDNPVWHLLEGFAGMDREELKEKLQTISIRYSKDFRINSLRGFLAMEDGELDKAEKHWKDAELSSPHPIVQAWHSLLQARSLESRGLYSQASILYDQISRACPAWLDAEYRKALCWIKSGFTEPALNCLVALIDKSGHFFNKALVDPEMERGYIQVMSCLNSLWTAMEQRAAEEEANLTRMREDLATWFLPDNAFALETAERIDKVLSLASVKNYVAFQMLADGRVQIEHDIQAHVMQEARNFKNSFRSFANRLKVIHEESAWFPFPKTLVEFNRSYNEGVRNLNWAATANFHTPEAFRKAQTLCEKEEERLTKLEGRLRFLRIVRDATLFLLSLVQTFLWLEAIGIILIFVVLPLFMLYGDKLGFDFAVSVISRDRWLVQKALFFVVSVLAVTIAGLRTLFRFENIRAKILKKAKEAAIAGIKGKK